ncbi:hypothetical protein [Streptomyces sp. NPDC057552]|uniref:hypothetical protein n=1 Tax=Streptomyces sp. NPDC057552 TaxID=3350537 RepID=UPI00368A76F0
MKKWSKGTALKSVRRLALVVDIEHYSRRTHPEQMDLQNRLDWIMGHAFLAAGVKTRRCYRQDQGDGLLFILPSEVQEGDAVPRLVSGVRTALYGANLVPGPGGRIRMRMALSVGVVSQGPTGFVGEGVESACSMVGSAGARQALADHPASDLAFIVNDHYFDDVVAQDFPGLRSSDFRPVTVDTKSAEGSTADAHVVALLPARTNKKVPVFTPASLNDKKAVYLVAGTVAAGGVVILASRFPRRRDGPGKGRSTASGRSGRAHSSPAGSGRGLAGDDPLGGPEWDRADGEDEDQEQNENDEQGYAEEEFTGSGSDDGNADAYEEYDGGARGTDLRNPFGGSSPSSESGYGDGDGGGDGGPGIGHSSF